MSFLGGLNILNKRERNQNYKKGGVPGDLFLLFGSQGSVAACSLCVVVAAAVAATPATGFECAGGFLASRGAAGL